MGAEVTVPPITPAEKGMIGHFLDPVSAYHPQREVTIHRYKATDFVVNPTASDVKKRSMYVP